MPETPTFVVNDRRKFTSDGELRHESATPSSSEAEAATEIDAAVAVPEAGGAELRRPQLVDEPLDLSAPVAELADLPESPAFTDDADLSAPGDEGYGDEALPPGPTEEQASEATRAYDATVERLDYAMRASNPGGERMPPMSFERLVQSLYTQSLMLLGGTAEPGETPRVDILGARQTIDMLSVIAEKTKGNLEAGEDKLIQSALFDLRMGFLEITQALARQAAQRQGAPGGGPGGAPAGPGGPRIVR